MRDVRRTLECLKALPYDGLQTQLDTAPGGAWSVRVAPMVERTGLPASLPEDMPPSSVELTLIALFVGTHLRSMKPKQRKAYMRTLMITMEEFHSLANVVRIRDRAFDAEVALSRRQATAWTRAMMGAYFMADCERE